jgi:hypothetical protein
MPKKQLAMERLASLFDTYGDNAHAHFQKRLIRAIFLLQNKTNDDCTKEEIAFVSSAIEELYNVFEIEELVV